MVLQERLKTVQYNTYLLSDLKVFCDKCSINGYTNNTFNAMRLEWCLQQEGQIFLTYLDDQLISLSGCHPLPQISNKCYRVLFRGVTLPEYQNLFKIISKTHMSSIPFYYHLPLEIEWAMSKGYNTFVVTTNWSNPDDIESMGRSHKVFQKLAKQNIVSCLIEKINIFNTEQSVWKINLDEYNRVRSEYGERNGLSK